MGVCEKSILFIAKEVYIFLTIILPYICIKLWNAKVIILPTEGIYLILYSFLIYYGMSSRLRMMRLQSSLGHLMIYLMLEKG